MAWDVLSRDVLSYIHFNQDLFLFLNVNKTT